MAARVYRRKQRVRSSIVTSMMLWSLLSLIPDVDVLGFAHGVAYADPWGHRGATHSLAFSLMLGLGIGLLGVVLRWPPVRTGMIAACVLVSHGLLDTFTDGGLGCALLWPFDHARFFAPWNPIPVSPIGLRIFSPWGLRVMATELLVFSPLLLYALWPRRKEHA